jgi:hypothetical protein
MKSANRLEAGPHGQLRTRSELANLSIFNLQFSIFNIRRRAKVGA